MTSVVTRRCVLGGISAAAVGLALPAPARPAPPGGIAVANRVTAINLTAPFKGPATLNARVRHTLTTAQAVQNLQLVYSNWALSASGKDGEVDGPSPLTFRAALEIDNRVHKLTFNGGAPEAVCAPGADVVTDPLDLSVPAGSAVFSRTFFSGASDRFPRPLPIYREWGEYIEILSDGPDKTLATSGLPNFNTTAGYGPSAILGTVARPQPAIAIIGDSIANGSSGGDNVLTATDNLGYIARAIANRYGFIRLTIPQDGLFAFTSDNRRRMNLLAGRITHAICEHGINDVTVGRPFEQIRARYLEQWSTLAEHGIKIFQCTLTPRTDSSDDHATLEGQRPVRGCEPGGVRQQVNDWIRTTPAPLEGYFEVADRLESSRNSGLWKVDGTPARFVHGEGGVHPTTYGHTLAAAAIDLARISHM
jgi:hypothetical protein